MSMKYGKTIANGCMLIIGMHAALICPKAYAMQSSTSCSIVRNARISFGSPPDIKSARQNIDHYALADYGHQVEDGHSNVLLVRTYEDDGKGVDSQMFMKLTIELADDQAREPSEQPANINVVRGYYSYGNIAFLGKGYYWLARDPVGSVSLAKTADGKMTLSIKSSFLAIYALDGSKKQKVIDIRCPVNYSTVKDLSPWEGKVGDHSKSFTPVLVNH